MVFVFKVIDESYTSCIQNTGALTQLRFAILVALDSLDPVSIIYLITDLTQSLMVYPGFIFITYRTGKSFQRFLVFDQL